MNGWVCERRQGKNLKGTQGKIMNEKNEWGHMVETDVVEGQEEKVAFEENAV